LINNSLFRDEQTKRKVVFIYKDKVKQIPPYLDIEITNNIENIAEKL
jgi:hypothetical protein